MKIEINFSLLETLANIAEIGGRLDYYTGNTAENPEAYVGWAFQFEKEYPDKHWSSGCLDYNDELYKFTVREILRSAELYEHTYDKSKIK